MGIDPKIHARLERASRRLFGAVSNALHLNEAFQVLNEPGPRRQTLAHSPGAAAIFLYENANVREQVLILCRVFDPPGDNRLSFPVVRQLLDIPGVVDYFAENARETWPFQDPDQSEATVRERVGRLNERLELLLREDPNRLKLLKNFRNTNLAHELWHETPRDAPQYRHIWELLAEAKSSIEDVKLVVEGASIGWAENRISKSATWLWDKVAADIA